MAKTLMVSVYSNPSYRKCASGGISETEDTIYVIADDGPFETDDTSPLLMEMKNNYGNPILVPVNPQNADKTIGPMMGGSFAYSSDSRFRKLASRCSDSRNFYGAVPIHDRYETPEQYEALSR